MLNRILRTIIGLPFVTFYYSFMVCLIILIYPAAFVACWVRGELHTTDFKTMPGEDVTGNSPVSFLKSVWKDEE